MGKQNPSIKRKILYAALIRIHISNLSFQHFFISKIATVNRSVNRVRLSIRVIIEPFTGISDIG
jgi:hypothetical protein